MKYKVIAHILDGVICAKRNEITCFIEKSLHDKDGHKISFNIGDELDSLYTNPAESYWSYSRKEWDKMNKAFQIISKK